MIQKSLSHFTQHSQQLPRADSDRQRSLPLSDECKVSTGRLKDRNGLKTKRMSGPVKNCTDKLTDRERGQTNRECHAEVYS